MRKWKKVCGAVLGTLVLGSLALLTVSDQVDRRGRQYQGTSDAVPVAQTAIVLGCFVEPDGQLCGMLEDRVLAAVHLYKTGKVSALLMSGDHGRRDYDEVNAMRRYAEHLGVPAEHIFMDHAGFNTWDTMVRARQVFCVKSAIVVTQEFHLSRAVFLARAQGIEAWGVAADRQDYQDIRYYEWRDTLARCKALAEVLWRPAPRFLGPPVPITGDGRQTRG